jgi:hypothetical protein
MEIDGEIVTLDQEKAYDKIHHKYLWRMLEAANLPNLFIKTVKSLYKNTFTVTCRWHVLLDVSRF